MPPQDAELCKSDGGGPPTCGCVGSSANLPQTECEAWISIFDSTVGPQWKYCKDSRLDPCNCSGAAFGEEYGVTCGGVDGRISQV
jgi:hypothetical protein